MTRTIHSALFPLLFCLLAAGCVTTEVDPAENNPNPNNRNRPDIGLPDFGGDSSLDDSGDQGIADTTADTATDTAADSVEDTTSLDATPDSTSADSTPDTNTDMVTDEEPDQVTMTECERTLTVGPAIQVDTSGNVPQYYARTAFDGSGVWVTYARRRMAGASFLDIYAARYGCDGVQTVSPTLISTSQAEYSHMQPIVTVSGEQAMFTWMAEERSTNTWSVRMRTMSKMGAPLTRSEIDITPKGGNGQNISQLIWELDAAPLSGGQQVITASYYDVVAGAFQVVANRINTGGGQVGGNMFPKVDKAISQGDPTVGTDDQDNVYIAYTRATIQGSSPANQGDIVYTKFLAGVDTPTSATPFVANPSTSDDGHLARYSKDRAPGGELYLSFMTQDNDDVMVKDGNINASLSIGTLGGNGYDSRPSTASKVGGGAVAWLKATTSLQNHNLYVAPFDFTNNVINTGNVKQISLSAPARSAGDIGTDITHVVGNTYFVTWTEGQTAGNTLVKGQFVQF